MYLTDYTFTDAAQKAIRLAQQLADEYSHATYGAAHLLWAVTREDVGLHPVFQQLERDPLELGKWANGYVEQGKKTSRYVPTPPGDDSALAVFKECNKLCPRYGEPEISALGLLEALATLDVGFPSDIIRRMPLALYEIIDFRDKNVHVEINQPAPGSSNGSAAGASAGTGEGQVLEKYCIDLNEPTRAGATDPLIGRNLELKQLLEILGKRISPNVMLVGEPGVGKTAMLGGLTAAILAGDVPDKLKDATVFELDISGRLVAGAYKGEVEERLKSILKALKAYPGRAILFIDEVHILLDEKGPVGSGVVNLLKPELSRGELTLIGATTQTEYQKYIEKDTAFNRRFSRLVITEPDETLAAVMLRGLMPRYEEFHGLAVDPPAIISAVTLAKRYVRDKYLPVSAIELLDFTMACATQMNGTSLKILEDVATAYAEDDQPDKDDYIHQLRNRLSELLTGRLGDADDMAKLAFPALIGQLTDWTATAKETITAEDVEAIIAYRSGIPIGRLRAKEQDKFSQVENTLRKRVVGQDHVISAVAESLKTFRANLKDPKDPGAIFFFVGPTGTGKTELAKAIAQLLFDDEDAMIRFDMSEFQESHSVAALLGSPPGYVGFEAGGLLVNKVRKQPYSVVLFDEIEKAHADIYGIFLQMLTDSRLQDKQGKMADFSNTIIIFTSNAGAHEMVEMFNQGKHPDAEELKEMLRASRHFKDEFLGRVDSNILPFKPLTEEVARMILRIHFAKFQGILLKQHQVKLDITDALLDHLVTIGFSPIYGARPLKNAIKSFLSPPIADKLILGEIAKGATVAMGIDGEGGFTWEIS